MNEFICLYIYENFWAQVSVGVYKKIKKYICEVLEKKKMHKKNFIFFTQDQFRLKCISKNLMTTTTCALLKRLFFCVLEISSSTPLIQCFAAQLMKYKEYGIVSVCFYVFSFIRVVLFLFFISSFASPSFAPLSCFSSSQFLPFMLCLPIKT